MFEPTDDGLVLRPVSVEVTPASSGTILPFFPTYEVACGAFSVPDREAHAPGTKRILASLNLSPETHFLAHARGDSMDGGDSPIKHGDLLLFQWLQNAGPADMLDMTVLVEQYGYEGRTQALKTLGRDAQGRYVLLSVNPEHEPIPASGDMKLVARLVRKLEQREYNSLYPHLHESYKRMDVADLYGETFNTGNWNSGHVSLDGRVLLFVTLEKAKGMTQYEDRLVAPDLLEWSSQKGTTRKSKKGREILEHLESGVEVHVWLRKSKGEVAFVYAGLGILVESEGEKPMRVKWRLVDGLAAEVWMGLGTELSGTR